MIATESDTDESSLSSDDSLVNSIIEENIIVEEKMNVSYVTKPEHSNIYLNEKKDECLICYKELKHNVKYEAILAQPINAHEKSLINANEVQNKIVVCLRGKSSFSKKARLCESFGASGVLVVNTLNVFWMDRLE